jgi:Uncharacterised nucleotidyltransferase
VASGADTGGRRPNAHEELLLRLARSESERTLDRARIAELAATSDAHALRSSLEAQRLLPLFGRRLRDLAGDATPAELVTAADVAFERARSVGRVGELALGHVLDALRDAGIRAAPLKGPRFAQETYGDVGLRISRDLDVLVEAGELAEAARIVTGLGWTPTEEVLEPNGLPLLHRALAHAARLPTVELHWRVHWYEDRFAQDALRRGVEESDQVRLQPADELACLLLFAIRDAFSGLKLTVDAITWLERDTTGAAREIPRLQGEYPPLARALGLAAEHVERSSGIEIPHLRPYGRARARIARGLADPLLRLPVKQMIAERGLVDFVSAPSRGLPAAFGRQVAPSAEELRLRAEIAVDRADRTRSRWSHAIRTTRRYCAAPVMRLHRPTQPGSLAT